MTTFVPTWPKAQDSLPLFANNLSPITGQWFNNVQVLVEVMQAELGLDIVHWPQHTLKEVIDTISYNRQGGKSALGRFRGLSRTVGSGATHDTLGLGTLQVTMELLNPEDFIPLVEAYPHLGTVLEASDVRGGIVNGMPFNDVGGAHDPAKGTTQQYLIQGAWSNGGVMSGVGTTTHHHVIFGLPEFV